MTVATILDSPIILSVLAFAAVVMVVLAAREPLQKFFAGRRVRARGFQLQLHLAAPLNGWTYGPPVAAALLFGVAAATGNWLPGAVLAFLLYYLLDGMPKRALAKRQKKLEAQLVDALTTMAHSLKAGLSLPQAVEQVANEAPKPISEEFTTIMGEYRHGVPIDQAFEDARGRMRSNNYDLAVTAFRVGQQRGGNLAEVFEKIGSSIREMWRLDDHIRSVTAQGRSSARFMTVMPFVFLVLLYAMDPQGVSLLFVDPVGVAILTVVLIMNLLCQIWIRKILSVDV